MVVTALRARYSKLSAAPGTVLYPRPNLGNLVIGLLTA